MYFQHSTINHYQVPSIDQLFQFISIENNVQITQTNGKNVIIRITGRLNGIHYIMIFEKKKPVKE